MTIPNPDPTPPPLPFLVQLHDIVLAAAALCAAVTVTVITVLVVNYVIERRGGDGLLSEQIRGSLIVGGLFGVPITVLLGLFAAALPTTIDL